MTIKFTLAAILAAALVLVPTVSVAQCPGGCPMKSGPAKHMRGKHMKGGVAYVSAAPMHGARCGCNMCVQRCRGAQRNYCEPRCGYVAGETVCCGQQAKYCEPRGGYVAGETVCCGQQANYCANYSYGGCQQSCGCGRGCSGS